MLLIAFMLSKRREKEKEIKQQQKKEVIELICYSDWIIIQYIKDQIIGC